MTSTTHVDNVINSMSELHGYVLDFSKYVSEEILPASGADGLVSLDEEKRATVSRRLNFTLSILLIVQDAMGVLDKEDLPDEVNHTIASLDASIKQELATLKRTMLLASCTNKVIH